jgi:hypothetical protein
MAAFAPEDRPLLDWLFASGLLLDWLLVWLLDWVLDWLVDGVLDWLLAWLLTSLLLDWGVLDDDDGGVEDDATAAVAFIVVVGVGVTLVVELVVAETVSRQ